MKILELLFKLFPAACAVFRWITRRKPSLGLVLVVEDCADDAELLVRKLTKRGYTCEIASTGETAAGLVKHTHYTHAFVDLRLPGMSGQALLRLLSKDAPHTQVVIVCGEPSDLKGIDRGQFYSLIAKPVDLEAIDDMIAKLKTKE